MSLRDKVVSGVGYTAAITAVNESASMVVLIVLARIIAPEVFGILAMSVVFTAISQIFVDLGTRDAIIRSKDADRGTLDSIFWANSAAGLLVATTLVIASPAIADLYGVPVIRPVVAILSINVVLAAIGIVPNALIMRVMKFRLLFYRTIIATPLSGGVAIGLALVGWGIWALVAQQLLFNLLSTSLVWIFARWRPRLYFGVRELRSVFSFSAYLSLSKIANYFTKQSDLFLVGWFLGPTPLGYYSRGYSLARRLLKAVNGTLVPVLYPALSALRGDLDRFRAAFCGAVQALALVYVPFFVVSVWLAEPAVTLLLGPQWTTTATVIPFFSAVILILAQTSVSSHALKALGLAQTLFQRIFLSSVVIVACFLLGLPWGIKGVAAGYVVGTVVQYLLVTQAAASRMELRLTTLGAKLMRVFALGMAMFGAVILVDFLLVRLGLEAPAFRLVGAVLSIAGAYTTAAMIHPIEPMVLLHELFQKLLKRAQWQTAPS